MSGSLDTSVLVQLVTGQTPGLAKQATRLVEDAKRQLAVADIAVIELIFVLEKLKKLKRSDIAAIMRMLAGQKKLNFNRPLFDEAVAVYVKCPALSIQDCCLAAYAQKDQAMPLWTFDKKLASQSSPAKLVE